MFIDLNMTFLTKFNQNKKKCKNKKQNRKFGLYPEGYQYEKFENNLFKMYIMRRKL